MALELIDQNEPLKFVPSCEDEAANPTTFYIRQESISLSMQRQRLWKSNVEMVDGKPTISDLQLAEDDVWLKYMSGRIIRIENVTRVGKIISLENPAEIRDFLKSPVVNAMAIGQELIGFLLGNTGSLSGGQQKN